MYSRRSIYCATKITSITIVGIRTRTRTQTWTKHISTQTTNALPDVHTNGADIHFFFVHIQTIDGPCPVHSHTHIFTQTHTISVFQYTAVSWISLFCVCAARKGTAKEETHLERDRTWGARHGVVFFCLFFLVSQETRQGTGQRGN